MIFYLSVICLILNESSFNSFKRKKNFQRKLQKFVSIFLTVVLCVFTFYEHSVFLLQCKECSLEVTFISYFTFSVYMLYRILLHKCLKKLEIFKKMISRKSCNYKENIFIPNWVKIWSCLIVFLNILAFGSSIKVMFYTDTLKMYFFNFDVKNNIWKFIISVIFSYTNFVLNYMPTNIFAVDYVTIYYEIKELILRYRSLIKHRQKFSYNKLTSSYNDIKFVIKYTDNFVGSLLSTSFVYNGILIYFGLSSFLKEKKEVCLT